MKVVWDESKNQINQSKHRLSFEVAQLVLAGAAGVRGQLRRARVLRQRHGDLRSTRRSSGGR